MVTCALCGFAKPGSVGIMVAGMSAMAPERRAEIARLGLRPMLAGALACCMAGAVIGLLTRQGCSNYHEGVNLGVLFCPAMRSHAASATTGERPMRRALLASAVALFALGGGAVAQNTSLPPAYGTLNLNAGFLPDPQTVNVVAGGNIDARRLGSNCVGAIANPPDVRLNYRAGNFPLFISVRSSADTTLVINLPNGQWLCNDDFQGLNPGVILQNPPSGQYDIWVGTFGGGTAAAQVLVSEVPPR
jgi:serine protease Do/protease YdgD